MGRMLKLLFGAVLALLPFVVMALSPPGQDCALSPPGQDCATPLLQAPSTDSPVVVEEPVGDELIRPPLPPAGLAVEHAAPGFLQSSGAGDEIVAELHMSTSDDGEPPFQNKFPSSTTTVYAVFSYQTGDPGQPLRVEVAYHDFVTGTATIFIHTDVYTGTGTTSVAIPVGIAFPDHSQFPIGRYTTTVSSTPDGGQTWEPAVSPAVWQVVIKPRDTHYERFQWNLNNTGQDGCKPDADIDAPEAWGITTGGSDVVIAVVGPGVYLGPHEDLQSKLWVNPGEIPDNGLDDDGNGYVDDVHGYDFTDEGRLEWPASYVGTFVAGIAAAATNNDAGMAGVSWGAQIMSVKVLRRYPDGSVGGTLEDVVEGMTYAVDNAVNKGVRTIIVTTFYVSENADLEVIEALRRKVQYAYEHGVLVVTGAGDKGENSPVVYPPVFPEVMAVSGTDCHDMLVPTSSCGYWVDVAAPSEDVISTYPCDDPYYCRWDERPYRTVIPGYAQSVYAAAHVAGLAALVWSVNPDLTVDQVREIIEGTADKVDADNYPYDPDGRNNCYGYGRINAERALLATPHALRLLTPLDEESRPLITYLMDDEAAAPLCYTITNPNTGAPTWRASTDADWLSLEGPSGWTPSQVEACADRRTLPGYGTYHAVITATSTLTVNTGNPVIIPATLVYTDTLWRYYWPLVPVGAWGP